MKLKLYDKKTVVDPRLAFVTSVPIAHNTDPSQPAPPYWMPNITRTRTPSRRGSVGGRGGGTRHAKRCQPRVTLETFHTHSEVCYVFSKTVAGSFTCKRHLKSGRKAICSTQSDACTKIYCYYLITRTVSHKLLYCNLNGT